MLKTEGVKRKISQNLEANKIFQIIPGVGKSLSQDFVDLGYKKLSELKNENPEEIYQNLNLQSCPVILNC